MIKVLVTGAGAVLGQGIVRALRISDLQLEIAAADPNPLSPALFWVDRGYIIPPANDPEFIRCFSDVLDRERPDIVLVGTDVELPPLAQHREALEDASGTRILVSSPRVVDIADDKYETFRFLVDAGLNPPLSALPDDPASVHRLIERVGYPLIVKPRIGARSVGVSIVNNDEELKAAIAGRSGLVVQELAGAADQEFTSSALVFDGVAEASVVMRRDLRDGNTHRAYVEPFEELNLFVREAAEALQPFGPVNFQFRTDAQGKPRVFEINARFSGATPLRALAGFNEVEMCIRRLLFGEPIQAAPLRNGIILRHLTETFVTDSDLARLR
jgi:carbamoyl-phosphate synthase large subunit